METMIAGEAALPQVDLNQERREERLRVLRRSRRHLAVVGALAALALTVLTPLTFQAVSLHQQLSGAEREAAGAQQRLQSVTAAGSRIDVRISRWTKLTQTQQSRRAWSGMLPALAACLPEDVSLQQVQVVQKGRDPQIELQGSAGTLAGLRSFTAALAQSSLFAQVHLDETTANGAAGPGGVSFQMAGPLSGVMASGAVSSSP